jgi:hypothetical protein
MENVWKDIRYAFRMLLKNRDFPLIAVLALGLGIGGFPGLPPTQGHFF